MWIMTSSGGSCNTTASPPPPPQVHFHHTATVRQLQLPIHTQRVVDRHISGTDRCSSTLLTVANHLPSGSRLDYEAGNNEQEDRHPVDFHQTPAASSAKMEEQMKMSRAGSTRPDMHSTPSAPFGTLQSSPSTIRSGSSTPTSSVSYSMAPKHGELSSQIFISCRPLSTDALETSSTSDGQTLFPTPTSGTRLVKAPLKRRSEKGNRG